MLNDGLVNFHSKMGTDRDKASGATYVSSIVSPIELSAAYRSSWLARMVVDRKSDDSTRKWREWHGSDDEVIAIEREEKRLKIKEKVNRALKLASLYGGSAIYLDTGQKEDEPLRLDAVRRGGLRFVNVINKESLVEGEAVKDPLNERYGKPEFYKLATENGSQVNIHWTRLAIFNGNETLTSGASTSWGDSDLAAVLDAMKQFEGAAANVSSLVYEAKIDVFSIKGLTDLVATTDGEDALKRRYALLAMMKGVNGMIVMDMENEKYDQKSASFGGLTDIIDKFQQIVCGATGYPRAILFGTGTGGLGSTGELELSSYYDTISERQENRITPAIDLLDECIIRSALGTRPPEVFYEWRSLWQMSDKEKAEIGKIQTDIVTALASTGLFDDDELRDAAVNMFTEGGTLPGLESVARDVDESGAI